MIEIKAPKKLIEVALPLDEINAASVREKSIRHGHPSTLHLWWARRPLAAARAVLFAQLVNDPGYERELGRGVNKEKAEAERKRLFEIIKKLVVWENTNNEQVLAEARAEIMKSWRETCELNKKHPQAKELFNPDKLPAFHDPFAGGGAIPLEAQRLGLEAWASDLNPVAVLINKAMIEIPPKFSGLAAVNPESRKQIRVDSSEWKGAAGLAEDVRYYGQWMRDEAERRIGHLYPKVKITEKMAEDRPDLREYIGDELTVIAWLWARTVKSPNPAFRDVDVPLISTFWLSKKKGKEAYIEPVINEKDYHFEVHTGKPENSEVVDAGTKLGRGASFKCILSNSPMATDYVRGEFQSKRNKSKLIAIVAEGRNGRVYLDPHIDQEILALKIKAESVPSEKMNTKTPDLVSGRGYGITHWYELFTPRQLTALTTFSDLVKEAREKALNDAIAAGMPDDKTGLEAGGTGAAAYADAMAVYLSFAVDKGANYWSSICSWHSGRDTITSTFGRQAIPMVWDFAEANPLSKSSGNYLAGINQSSKLLKSVPGSCKSVSIQNDAMLQKISKNKIVSTDPPYYDNIGYADLSDFFYVWLRRSLKPVMPSLFSTMAVPKSEELIAAAYRHGSKAKAEAFFMEGMTEAMRRLSEQANPLYPVTIYYAFKQSETKEGNTSSSGWETFLEAVIISGFSVNGTWPMRTELTGNLKKKCNALASSIVLVCRKRGDDADVVSRKEFLKELKRELPEALDEMTESSIAPVDLAQASIGPGMAVFSKYSAVLEADGTKMTVHDALVLINRELDEYFSDDSGDLDADTRFCLAWFDENSWKEGKFGEADVLARARGTTVEGVKEAGVIESGSGKVRLYRWSEYPDDWSPEKDSRTPVWEALHHLIRVHQCGGGEAEAALLLSRMSGRALSIKQLAYRLYTLCERKGWAEDARPYNELITSWGEVEARTPEAVSRSPQKSLDSF